MQALQEVDLNVCKRLTPDRTDPDRWWFDQLLAWEEKRMEPAESAAEALVSTVRDPIAITDLLPQPKRRWRSA